MALSLSETASGAATLAHVLSTDAMDDDGDIIVEHLVVLKSPLQVNAVSLSSASKDHMARLHRGKRSAQLAQLCAATGVPLVTDHRLPHA